jgi:hypothetical protein
LQQIAIRGVVVLQTAIDAGELTIADIRDRLRFIPPLENRLLFFFERMERVVQLGGVLLPLLLDALQPFLDLRDANGDFFCSCSSFLSATISLRSSGKFTACATPSRPSAISLFWRTRFSCRNAIRVFWRRTFSPISRNPVRMKLTR